ncbi:heparinase II/III domain-containing protein [Puniceicoccus vermicola]|nr:heparinase II/III family protein [Puniceicoccus vermicola]
MEILADENRTELDAAKEKSLLDRVDWSHPALESVREAPDKAAALLAHLATSPRRNYQFEYECKGEILAFLNEHYEAWRNFDTTEADRLEALSIEEAQGPRALSTVARLGQAWWATGDPRYGRAFERFYRALPTGEMFNWQHFNGSQGAIELDTWLYFSDCEGFTREGRIAVLDHICAITDDAWERTSGWTQRTLGPEGHNWYLHGMHVLPFYGIFFPEFKQADYYLRSSIGIMEEHLRGHYRADGGARETSLGYQGGSLTHLWDFYLLAQRNGVPLSSEYRDRLLHATHFLLRLATPNGSSPCFGDMKPNPGGLTNLAAVSAAVTGDREAKWYAERFRHHRPGVQRETQGELPLSVFWKVGLAGARVYAGTRSQNPRHKSVLMGATGYGAMRNSDHEFANYLAVAAADRGPIVTSHGHNEVFSMEIHALGQRFVGEMGCVNYGDSPAREYDQKTEAHTCLTIDGMEQAELENQWRWKSQVIPCVRRWIREDTHDFFDGVHEGFNRGPDKRILHARKILFFKSEPSYFLVFDWIDSDTENPVSAYFHGCCPGELEGDGIRLDSSNASLAILPPEDSGLHLERVSDAGLDAYREARNLNAENYPVFAFRKKITSDCLVWGIVPRKSSESTPQIKRLPVSLNGKEEPASRAVAVEVQFDSHTDHVMLSHTGFDAEMKAGTHSAWGFLSINRSGDGLESRIIHRVSDGVCGR